MADLVYAPALPSVISSFNPCHSFSTLDLPHIRTVLWCKIIPCAGLENTPSNALAKGRKNFYHYRAQEKTFCHKNWMFKQVKIASRSKGWLLTT